MDEDLELEHRGDQCGKCGADVLVEKWGDGSVGFYQCGHRPPEPPDRFEDGDPF